MPEISRLKQHISVVMFEILELFCHFGVLWFESKLLATGNSGWTVAKFNVVKMESALFGYFSHLDGYLVMFLVKHLCT